MSQTIFKTIPTKDEHTNKVQSNVTDAFNRLQTSVNGTISSNVSTLQALIDALQQQVNGITVPTTIKIQSAVVIGAGGSFSTNSTSYAILNCTTAGTATIGVQSFTVAVGQTYYLGPSSTITSTASSTFSGVLFTNN